MNKIRYYIVLYIAKLAQLFIKLLGRNATFLPGKIAIALYKDFLAQIKPPKTVIAVTGTNGKTTVSNLITSILTKNGYSVTNNSLGSNVQAGVISALIEDTTFLGKPKKDIAVLEVDERSSLLIYPRLDPDYLVCTNLMRDSIKRNAHTEFIRYVIDKALPQKTTLVLNADDLIASSLGSKGQARIHFGVAAEQPTENVPQHIRDIVYCNSCGGLLEPDYVRYNHIGRFHCTSCDLRSPAPDFVVTDIDRKAERFTLQHNNQEYCYHLINDNIVNVYNFSAVIALLTTLGLDYDQIAKGFSEAAIVQSRFRQAETADIKITLIMSKGQNPIACTRCFDYAAKSPAEGKAVIVMIDDKADNTGDSECTCWLYDSDYSGLADSSFCQVIFGGPRSKDHYLRALLAGVDPEKISITDSATDTASLIDIEKCKEVYVLFDLYSASESETVKQALLARMKGDSK